MPKVNLGTDKYPKEVDTDVEELLLFSTSSVFLLSENMMAGEFGRLKKLRCVSLFVFFSECLWRKTCVLVCGFVRR